MTSEGYVIKKLSNGLLLSIIFAFKRAQHSSVCEVKHSNVVFVGIAWLNSSATLVNR